MENLEWVIGLSAFTIINILIWVFTWGRRTGRVNARLNSLENRGMLPECVELFADIREKLSNLDGKFDVMMFQIKNAQKINERKRT